ncbi:MAG: hypothetical protein ACKVUS_19100 [Saprospiraceae bacterium]
MTNKTVYLFHEGGSGGLDQTVLKKIPFEGRTVIPQPFGGKFGHARFIEGFGEYAKSLGTELAVVGFRDRDFDFPVPQKPALTKANENVYAGYRTTLENYLLDTEVFFSFTKDEKQMAEPGTLFSDVLAVKTLFDRAAQDILVFQAARYALGLIRSKAEQKTNFRDYEEEKKLKNKTKFCYLSSNTLPPSLAEKDCLREAHMVIETFQGEAAKYSKEHFEEAFEHCLKEFREPDFIQQDTYLVWFQGKTLQESMKPYLPRDFPMNAYNKYAAAHFDYTKHPDLMELKNTLNAL